MSCLICAEKLNGSSRKLTKCEFCEFEACLTCCKTYILGEPFAKCMAADCNKEWSRGFIANACGQTFVNKAYKQHREQILYDKERALLPATQQIVERIKMVEQLKQEVKEIDAERLRLMRKKDDLIQTIMRLEDSKQEVERVLFTKACPSSTCRGYLNTQWKCGLCQITACRECHEIKNEDHECNPDSVATAKLLAADTKPCPQCHAGIHKIDGCDQMWCTLCHTAFSWRTGKRETVIHNPHYYEFMRKQSATGEIPRNEMQCNAELSQYTVARIRQQSAQFFGADMYRTDKEINDQIDVLGQVVRSTLHIAHSELTGRYKEINYVEANQDLRVSFMRDQITEEKFKVLLQRNEKGNQKRQEIRAIFQMVQTTVTDTIHRFQANMTSKENIAELLPIALNEISAIADYANEQFAEIAKTYKMPLISLASDLKIKEKVAKRA